MRLLGTLHGTAGQRPGFGHQLGRALCSLVVLLAAPMVQAQTPAGTQITAFAQVTYEASNGVIYMAQSQTVVMTVAQVAGVDVEPPRSTLSDPGATVVFAHTLVNIGNGLDSLVVAATSQTGWPARVYRDANASGGLDAGDPLVTGPIPLAMGDTAQLLIAIDVPGSAAVRGVIDTIDVVATSEFDGSVSDALQDVLEIRDVGILVSLNKTADRATATTGDVVTYTIAYSASGPNTANNFELTDPIPTGTSYVAGTMQWNGAPLTDATGDDAGFFDVANNRVVLQIGTITGGDNGTVRFQVRIS